MKEAIQHNEYFNSLNFNFTDNTTKILNAGLLLEMEYLYIVVLLLL